MKIYNTLTRKKEEFVPLRKGQVRMYVCGPTVYDVPHIGHARSAYVFDVIRRYLAFKGYKVKFVRNVTDVDDKIIEKAKEEYKTDNVKSAVKEISQKYLKAYHECMDETGLLKPDKEPKATEYIGKMIKFIELLIKRKAAYAADSDVYFDIKKAKNYGKLSNQNLDKMEAGARVAPDENKKDPLDFALWKKAKEGEPSWPSPWGEGRPGWHIECSVMSSDILGDEFDIHAGGIDLIFPHHENEIAQSEGAGKKFARLWMHNGLLTINGEKMAKSFGNFITIKDFVARHKDVDLLKLLFLSSHYRHPVDYSEERLDEVARMKERIMVFLGNIEKIKNQKSKINGIKKEFIEAMDNDFNTPKALASIFELVTLGNTYLLQNNIKYAKDVAKLVKELCSVLGLGLERVATIEPALKEKVEKLIKERDIARQNNDFEKADNIRSKLLEEGVILEDTKEGTVWRRKL